MSEKTTAQEILEDLEGEEGLTPATEEPITEKQPEEKPEVKEPVQEEIKTDEPSALVITKEFVEKYGLSKHLVGKPIDELGNSYSNMIKKDTKISQEMAQLREQVESLKATKSEEIKAEQQTIEELGEIPDPVDDIDAYRKWMKEFKTNLKAEVLSEINPKLQKAEELTTNDLITETIDLIKQGLPEGTDPKEVLAEYIRENKDYFDELIGTKIGRTPQSLAKETLRDFKSKAFDKNSKLTDEEIVKRASEIAQQQLKKKVGSTKVTDMNTNSRALPSKGLVADIISDLEAEKD